MIHLAPREAPGEVGWVNHIAFSGYDFDGKTAELSAAGFAFKAQRLPDSDIRQIFVDGPEESGSSCNARRLPDFACSVMIAVQCRVSERGVDVLVGQYG